MKSTLQFKIFGSIFLVLVLLCIHYFLQANSLERQLASDIESAQPDWTRGQKLKWALTRQFTISIANNKLSAKNTMTPSLCEGNHGLRFGFKAFEVMIAGANPQIDVVVGCEALLQMPDYNFVADLGVFPDLQTKKRLDLDSVKFNSSRLYQDEEWPKEWELADIEILGPNGFVINQFEIQDALKQVYSFTISK